MARGKAKGPGKRVMMNREALDAIRLGMADGMQAVGVRIIERAQPNVPDAPPWGKGLLGGGMVVTLVDRRKVAAYGPTAGIPRSARAPALGTVTYVGYGYPGRFAEIGTVRYAGHPFVSPSAAAEIPTAGAGVAQAIADKLKGVRS